MNRSNELEQERTALLAEIDAAFANVSRDGGVSWSEADVIDDYGTEEERREARARDTDRHWRELVNDKNWDPDGQSSRFCFLDGIGMRYYLPAAMQQCINEGSDTGVLFTLTYQFRTPGRNYAEKLWHLDQRQCRCIAKFLVYMREFIDHDRQRTEDTSEWDEALDMYWRKYL